MRQLIRWLSFAALIVLMLPILHEFALKHHIYNLPTESDSILLGYARKISEIPHYEYMLAFVCGLTLGTWTDAILTGTTARKSQKHAALADRTFRVREAVQIELGNVNRQRDHASALLLAEVNSLMLDLRKAGVPVPLCTKGY
jgi:hypothetical protein